MLPGKRIHCREVPFATPAGTVWRMVEEYDTGEPVVEALPEDFIAQIVTAFMAKGGGRQGRIGDAPSVLVDAAEILPFAVARLKAMAGGWTRLR